MTVLLNVFCVIVFSFCIEIENEIILKLGKQNETLQYFVYLKEITDTSIRFFLQIYGISVDNVHVFIDSEDQDMINIYCLDKLLDQGVTSGTIKCKTPCMLNIIMQIQKKSRRVGSTTKDFIVRLYSTLYASQWLPNVVAPVIFCLFYFNTIFNDLI